jgi:MFS transporter, NNP family, nitrate/nitrite transporter
VPNYYPKDVGAVGGLVGALGALGGFVLPPVFGAVGRWTGSPQSAFLALLALTLGSLAWLHLAVMRLKRTEVTPTGPRHRRGHTRPHTPERTVPAEVTR